MLCRMPVLSLPADLTELLENSETKTIDNTDGPGVAVYWSSDRRTRADIYIGLKLDGFKLYQDISSVEPDIKMQFAVKPVVFCEYDELDFDPNKDKLIAIEVIVVLISLLILQIQIQIQIKTYKPVTVKCTNANKNENCAMK